MVRRKKAWEAPGLWGGGRGLNRGRGVGRKKKKSRRKKNVENKRGKKKIRGGQGKRVGGGEPQRFRGEGREGLGEKREKG